MCVTNCIVEGVCYKFGGMACKLQNVGVRACELQIWVCGVMCRSICFGFV